MGKEITISMVVRLDFEISKASTTALYHCVPVMYPVPAPQWPDVESCPLHGDEKGNVWRKLGSYSGTVAAPPSSPQFLVRIGGAGSSISIHFAPSLYRLL
jgi:hypothetical protein